MQTHQFPDCFVLFEPEQCYLAVSEFAHQWNEIFFLSLMACLINLFLLQHYLALPQQITLLDNIVFKASVPPSFLHGVYVSY